MAATHSALLILNGKSAQNAELRSAIEVLREQSIPLHVRVTWEHGDAKRYVDEAVALDVSTVISGGGDGTINEVSDALLAIKENRPSLGILPLGTANDFATACHIPTEMGPALELAIKGRAVPIDVVCVNDERIFINVASGGFGTKITTDTPETMKSMLGGFSYFLHGISSFNSIKPDVCTIESGDFQWSGEALVIGIGNGRTAGGGQPLCPTALINDGLLQLRVLTSKELIPTLLSNLLKGETDRNIVEHSASCLNIHSQHEMTLNLDGEPIISTEFRIKVIPDAISCRLPPDCPLLK